MPSVTQRLTKAGLISPPGFLQGNIHYECAMGSVAYGVSGDMSDIDLYGFCIPPKSDVFPHLRGVIPGFGRQIQRFEQFQQHHIDDPSSGKQYDISIYSIVKYFQLCMENNPNMIDSLFVPQFCVLHMTQVGNLVRENRKLFLHKGCFHKMKGYAYSQLHKMSTKTPEPDSKRAKDIETHGFDCKFAYHVVRLLGEAEMILREGDLDLQRNREQLKAIRRGEMTEEAIRQWASDKEHQLEELYHTSTLQHSPDEGKIKELLLQCLEMHYGSLQDAVISEDQAVRALRSIRDVIEANRKLIDG